MSQRTHGNPALCFKADSGSFGSDFEITWSFAGWCRKRLDDEKLSRRKMCWSKSIRCIFRHGVCLQIKYGSFLVTRNRCIPVLLVFLDAVHYLKIFLSTAFRASMIFCRACVTLSESLWALSIAWFNFISTVWSLMRRSIMRWGSYARLFGKSQSFVCRVKIFDGILS